MDELAVYIHWPFCLAKCPYCDFNSHVAETIDHDRWRAAYAREIDHVRARTGPRRVTSIFFGGGTPSLMEPETVAAAIAEVGQAWTLAPDLEISLEANPTSVEAARLKDFRSAGVNRLSLGVQALDDAVLAFLGRKHGLAETRRAIATAARTFDNWSMDLIYARPGQTVEDWRAELADALTYAPPHLSAYQLTIEKGTPFYAADRAGQFTLPDDELAAALYETTGDVLARAGLVQYEVSNYARPGHECRHNLSYWRYRDYAGIGPGAHGRLTLAGAVHATRRIASPAGWLAAVETRGQGTQADDALDPPTVRDEVLMMGLRLNDGINAADFAVRTGGAFDDPALSGRMAPLIDAGYLAVDARAVRATPAGRLRLNAVIGALCA